MKSSQEYPVEAGVSQGSIFGPAFFLLYIDHLPDDIVCNIAFYADDTKKKKKKKLWPLFMDGLQQPQGYSHFQEAVYFLPFSSQKFLVLILSTSEG